MAIVDSPKNWACYCGSDWKILRRVKVDVGGGWRVAVLRGVSEQRSWVVSRVVIAIGGRVRSSSLVVVVVREGELALVDVAAAVKEVFVWMARAHQSAVFVAEGAIVVVGLARWYCCCCCCCWQHCDDSHCGSLPLAVDHCWPTHSEHSMEARMDDGVAEVSKMPHCQSHPEHTAATDTEDSPRMRPFGETHDRRLLPSSLPAMRACPKRWDRELQMILHHWWKERWRL
mmetsp:Transcript_7515/g.15363  ORF Transcript_7515/g.15363 Transcript_7515/m.15363 type:complete len:229 (-) Transcript_7515:1235-1921(-)